MDRKIKRHIRRMRPRILAALEQYPAATVSNPTARQIAELTNFLLHSKLTKHFPPAFFKQLRAVTREALAEVEPMSRGERIKFSIDPSKPKPYNYEEVQNATRQSIN